MTFGERLRQCRKAKELTQKELALKIGARHTSISDWEKNKNIPDGNKIILLIKALDVSPEVLVGDFDLNDLVDLEESDNPTFAKLTNEQRIALEYAKAVTSEVWKPEPISAPREIINTFDEVTGNIVDVLKDFAEEEKRVVLDLVKMMRRKKDDREGGDGK